MISLNQWKLMRVTSNGAQAHQFYYHGKISTSHFVGMSNFHVLIRDSAEA